MTELNISERIEEIQNRIMDTTNEMLRRAMSHDPFKIEDEKDSGVNNAEGILQDCEFGLNLLLVREWMREKQVPLRGELADDVKIEGIILNLAKAMVGRVFNREKKDKGGILPKSAVFFSTDPYSKAEEYDGKLKNEYFRSNLDAAMIMTAFSTMVLQQYNSKTVATSTVNKDKTPEWVENLRDELLYLCDEALEYAEKCKVTDNGLFLGFTIDPTVNTEKDTPISKFDRLFFTWTTCETIADLKDWGPYLDQINKEKEIATHINRKINRFEKYLAEASDWCSETFFQNFSNLNEVSQIKDFVQKMEKGQEIEDMGERQKEVQEHVQHAYHLSQYLSIRSLSPLGIPFSETESICNQLSQLVIEDIIESGLDSSDDENVSNMLTRSYAKSPNSRGYLDDAYYPMVVRSLAKAVTRVMDGFRKTRMGRERGKGFLDEFVTKLEIHYENLINRVAGTDENTLLWSYAENSPYAFYASQRTIFSLMSYADFLEKFEEENSKDTQTKSGSTDATRFHESMAQSLASMSTAMNQMVELTRNSISPSATPLTLPQTPWAGEAIREWVGWFTTEFEEKGLMNTLEDRAGKLVSFHKWYRTFDVEQLKGKGQPAKRLQTLEKCQTDILLELPSLKDSWEQEELDAAMVMPMLFAYQFRQFVNHESTDVVSFFGSDLSALWQTISSAEKARNAIDNSANTSYKTNLDEGKNS